MQSAQPPGAMTWQRDPPALRQVRVRDSLGSGPVGIPDSGPRTLRAEPQRKGCAWKQMVMQAEVISTTQPVLAWTPSWLGEYVDIFLVRSLLPSSGCYRDDRGQGLRETNRTCELPGHWETQAGFEVPELGEHNERQ